MKQQQLRALQQSKFFILIFCGVFFSFILKNENLINGLVRNKNKIEIVKGKTRTYYEIKNIKDYSHIRFKNQDYFLNYDEPCQIKNFDSIIFDNLVEDTLYNPPFFIAIFFVDKTGKIQEKGAMRLLSNNIKNYSYYNNYFQEKLLQINSKITIVPSKILNKSINSIVAIRIDINNRNSEIYSIIKLTPKTSH